MKYQDFSSDEDFVSREETIFIFRIYEDGKVVITTSVLANRKQPSQDRARLTFSFTNQPPWKTR